MQTNIGSLARDPGNALGKAVAEDPAVTPELLEQSVTQFTVTNVETGPGPAPAPEAESGNDDDEDGLGGGVIVGIVLGILAVIALGVGIVLRSNKEKQRRYLDVDDAKKRKSSSYCPR